MTSMQPSTAALRKKNTMNQESFIKEIKGRIGQKELVAILAAMMAVNSFAIDIMLPAMTSIIHSFSIYVENDQHYIISAYLLGYSIAQILFGPLSDRYGRRVPLLAGLICYTVTALGCVYAPSFGWFLFFRVLQGVGGASSRVLSTSIVRDIYGGQRMAQVMSIVTMVFMLAPVIAPATGQLLLCFGSWQVIFLFMAAAGAVIGLWIYWRLPETLYEKRALSPHMLFSSFRIILSDRAAMCYTFTLSLLLGGLFGSLNTAKQVYSDVFGLGKLFSIAFASVAVSQAVISFLNARLIMRFGMRCVAHTALLSYCAASFMWFLWTFLHHGSISFSLYMFLFIIIMASFGAMGSIFNALAMESLGNVAGTASSVFGLFQTSLGTAIGFLIAQQFDKTTQNLAAGFLTVGLLSIIFVLIAEKGKFYGPDHSQEMKVVGSNEESHPF